MIILILLASFAAVSLARPNVDTQNVVTVPPNCPAGQEWINGQCRDVWKVNVVDHVPTNIVTVPPNCPSGQQYINGQCRDVWKILNAPVSVAAKNYVRDEINSQNTIVVPPNCLPNQQLVNGQCRDIWRHVIVQDTVNFAPHNCPSGQEYINGFCRDVSIKKDSISKSKFLAAIVQEFATLIKTKDVEMQNIISVPNQCPSGFKPDALGICREIFDF